MSKPALFYYLLWSDSTSGATVLDLPLPLPLRLRAPSRRQQAGMKATLDPLFSPCSSQHVLCCH